ncbi:MAG: hypothetical protein LBF83_02095 [Spirochaetaceae bacterium]|jgi:hypothetical protein|nr:hypothetical protein [Spirochaetaceae bacterium]
MKQINKNNVKKVLAATGKFVGTKVVPTFGLAAALTLPLAPLSAQDPPPPPARPPVMVVINPAEPNFLHRNYNFLSDYHDFPIHNLARVC